MAKQILTWKNIELNAMPKDLNKLFSDYHRAHDAMVSWFEMEARKHKALSNGQTVKLSIRGNVIGFAIANGAATTSVDAKSMFA